MRKTQFASVHLTHEARDALRLATLRLQGQLGRRLTQSEVLLAAIAAAGDALAQQIEAGKR
jgi:hypothetical protein